MGFDLLTFVERMDQFIDVFVRIADEKTNCITHRQLQAYVDKHNLDPGMIPKWDELFDLSAVGYITQEKFCDVLGIHAAQVEEYRRTMRATKLGSDVTVIHQQMSELDQAIISGEVRKMNRSNLTMDNQERARRLRQFLDEQYGRSWQVVVSAGLYAIECRHLADNSFHFRMNNIGFSLENTF